MSLLQTPSVSDVVVTQVTSKQLNTGGMVCSRTLDDRLKYKRRQPLLLICVFANID